jgi:hypothetical protein
MRVLRRCAVTAAGDAARAFLHVRRLTWRLTKPIVFGVRAIALTPDKKVILVKHSYMKGWHLRGGSRKKHETPEDALFVSFRRKSV